MSFTKQCKSRECEKQDIIIVWLLIPDLITYTCVVYRICYFSSIKTIIHFPEAHAYSHHPFAPHPPYTSYSRQQCAVWLEAVPSQINSGYFSLSETQQSPTKLSTKPCEAFLFCAIKKSGASLVPSYGIQGFHTRFQPRLGQS